MASYNPSGDDYIHRINASTQIVYGTSQVVILGTKSRPFYDGNTVWVPGTAGIYRVDNFHDASYTATVVGIPNETYQVTYDGNYIYITTNGFGKICVFDPHLSQIKGYIYDEALKALEATTDYIT